jgi:uncharacterized protein (TIGR03067 family)
MKFAGLFLCIWFALAVAVVPALSADTKDDPIKKELEKLQGKWDCVSVVMDGKELEKTRIKGLSVVFKGTKAIINEKSPIEVTAEVTIDPTKKPAEIDFRFDIDSVKGGAQKGIYKLVGDMLTVCSGPQGGARPTEFKSTANFTLSVYKRAN